jgi:hypothetical protein
MIAIQEFVVPKSIPKIFAMVVSPFQMSAHVTERNLLREFDLPMLCGGSVHYDSLAIYTSITMPSCQKIY